MTNIETLYKQLNNRYQALFEYAHVSILIHDLEGQILEVNQKTEKMFGRNKEEFLTLSTSDLPAIENKEKCKQIMQTIKEQGFIHFESNFISKDKTIFPVQVSSSLIEIDGMPMVQTIVRDVRVEKETLNALEKTTEAYADLFENSAFGALIIDSEKMEVLNCNQIASDMLGIPKENPAKWDVKILHKSLSPNEFKHHLSEVNLNHSHSYTTSVIDKNGLQKELLISCRKVEFKGVVSHLSILIDITEKRNYQRELEEKNAVLKKSQENYQSILDNMQDTYYRTNLKGELIDLSKGVEALSGYKANELLGQPLSSFYVNPMMRNEFLQKMSANNGKLTFQAELVHKNKNVVWIYTNSRYWYNDEGNIGGVEGFARDITQEKIAQEALKKNEERWGLALEGAKHGVWDTNLKNNTIFHSKQWSAMLGYEDYEIEKTFRSWTKLIHPQDLQQALKTMNAYAKGEIETYQQQFRMLCKDGSYKWIITQGAIWERDTNGNPLRIVGTHSDITELKEAYQQIKAQEEMMLVQSRHAAMGEMISMIAHLWRQPISLVGLLSTTIMHCIQSNKINTESMLNDLNTINDQINYMSKTIDDFRNFFQKSNTIEEVNLYYLLIEAKSILSALLQRQNIELIIDCPISIVLYTYSRELVQVIINILSNAKDALEKVSDKKNINITVVEKNEQISIAIFNNGAPIEESIKNKIFEPYFTTKGNFGGTGLGLYMVKSILDKHMHGKIEVQIESNGVTFIITIPKALK